MRLTAILVLVSLMQVSAASFGQRVTISQQKASLSEIFREIKKQSGYGFVFDRKVIDNIQNINVQLDNVSVEQALKRILTGLPLSFNIDGETILITEKSSDFIGRLLERFNAIDVRGKVLDDNGRPLAGATVKIKGSSQSVKSNSEGEFLLRNVDENAVLEISYIGFVTREVKASSDIGQLKLLVAASALNEVTINAGYYNVNERDKTGAISTLTSEQIAKQPVSNPLAAMIGRLSGVDVVQQSGIPGGGFSIRVRGQNSLLSNNEPLYLIDGVPFATNSLTIGNRRDQPTVTPSQAGGASPFNVLNPADIESITVLKDADATAIYGSRGANGVVLITTKRGKSGDTQVSLNVASGITRAGRFQEMMNRRQYLDMRYEALRNDGIDWKLPGYTQAPDLTVLDTNVNNNIQKELLGGTGRMNNIQATVSGGNANTRFSMGGGYFRESTIFPGNQFDEKISGRFSIDHLSLNKKFTAQLSGSYGTDNNNTIATDFSYKATVISPIQQLIGADGKLNWATGENALASLYQPYNGKSNNLQVNGVFGYEIMPGLQFKIAADYSAYQFNSTFLRTEVSQWPLLFSPASRTADFGRRATNTWNLEPQLSYKRELGAGKLELLAGATLQQTTQNGSVVYAVGFADDALMYDPQSASSLTTSSEENQYKYSALFGRITYTLSSRYILSLNGRRDGSSRFGQNNNFGNFGSVGASWIFSEEALLKRNSEILSFGKLRISHGVTGSDRIGDYRYISYYRALRAAEYKGPGSALVPANLGNEEYQWETNVKTDLALTLGFFRNRVMFDGAFYINRSSDQLVGLPLPSMTGFASVIANLPATVRNTGLELEMTTINFQKKSFNWTSSFNLTLPKNKLVAYPNLEASPYANNYVVGQPINLLKVFPNAGVDPETGKRLFINRFGQTTTDKRTLTQEDKTVFLDLGPKYFGGFANTFNYKGFELEVFFQYSQRTGSVQIPQATAGSALFNLPLYVYERRWQNRGDVTDIPKFTSLTDAATNANRISLDDESAYRKISYIRLKNLSLYYTIPQNWQRALHLKNLRLYGQAQNLLTFTNYEGMDPENASSGTGPLKVITAGIQINL